MNPIDIINKYYLEENELRHILLTHSRSVADKSLWIANRHPELSLDKDFLYEAAMLHDIGIFLTDAPGIYCFGDKPYICHGYLGADLMRGEGYPRHALVCERHTGAGLSLEGIIAQVYLCRIAKWFRLVWKNKLSVLPISFIQKLIWKRRKVWKKPVKVWNVMVKKGYVALIIGANCSCSNLNFFKKGNYPYKLRTFAPPSVNY